jgi:hypothetical protein
MVGVGLFMPVFIGGYDGPTNDMAGLRRWSPHQACDLPTVRLSVEESANTVVRASDQYHCF